MFYNGRPPTTTFIAVAVGIFVVAFFFGDVFSHSALQEEFTPKESSLDDVRSVRDAVRYWRARIRTVGPEAAYAELKRSDTSSPRNREETLVPGLQHQEAHRFGAALYQELGTRGFSVCGTEFSYGCVHEFVGQMLADNSLSILPSLNDSCTSMTTLFDEALCQHGLGHGVLGYFGYTERALMKALEICRGLGVPSLPMGCYGGVFMEYNLRPLWLLPRSKSVRNPDPVGRPGLCVRVPDYARPSCLSHLPQWWAEGDRVQQGPKAIFALGQRCAAEVVTLPDRRSCLLGVGQFTFGPRNTLDDVSEDIQRACGVLTDESDVSWCIIGSIVSARFYGMRFGEELCSAIKLPAERRICGSFTAGDGEVFREIGPAKLIPE